MFSFKMSVLLSLVLASLAACSSGFSAAPTQFTSAWHSVLSPIDPNTDAYLSIDDANRGRSW